MLRGLLIRQFLLLVDLVLAVLLLAAAYFSMARLFESDAPMRVSAKVEESEPKDSFFRPPVEEAAYASIISAGLYGSAASVQRADTEPEAAVGEPEVVETSLPLRLFGTAAASPKDPLGSAVIENSEGGAPFVDTYFPGQKVIRNVVLEEIHHMEVILYNPDDNTREVLRSEGVASAQSASADASAAVMSDTPPGARGSAVARSGSRGSSSQYDSGKEGGGIDNRRGGRGGSGGSGQKATKQLELNKNEVAQEIAQLNLAQAYAELSPSMASDESGKPIGLTASNISKFPLAQKFGFQDGDIITKINGVDIDSEQRAFEVVNRFQNATTHYVTVLRNGQPVQLEFRLQ